MRPEKRERFILERRYLDLRGRGSVQWDGVSKPIQDGVDDSDGALADINEKLKLILDRLEGFGVIRDGGTS